MNRYEELLLAAAPTEMRNAGQIYIPPGPRLGNVVVDCKGVRKSFGDRLLIDGLDFSLPPNGIVGVVGPNGAGKRNGIIRCVCCLFCVVVGSFENYVTNYRDVPLFCQLQANPH